ncbi:MAG: diguanylate cyclase [Chloroflexota bacterium]|nr:MAG: diguanylate cyclase [Chloroflexota bacterium]
MQFNFFSLLILICAALLAAIAGYAWRHRATSGARLFSIFILAQALYTLGYSFELASSSLPSMLFWNRIQYVGICSFPTLFLLFAIKYSGGQLARRTTLLLFVIPAINLAAKFTDTIFGLVYSSAWIDFSGPIPTLAFTRGPFYYVSGLYTLVMISAGVFVLWQKRRYSSLLYRSQATVVAGVAFVALAFYVAYLAGYKPFPSLEHLDLYAFSYPLWAALISWALFRYRLFDLAPVAREALVENLVDGMVVLDGQCRIVDTNPAGLTIFGWKTPPIGLPARQMLSDWIELPALCPVDGSARAEIRHESAGEIRYYDVNISTLKDKNRRPIGHLILVHDITERRLAEERLRELSLVDDLTCVNNRRGFFLLATQSIHMVQRMNLSAVLIYADMDNLKRVNDTLGHAVGDQAVIDIADILKGTIRSSDVLGRLGGDEFVVLVIESQEKSGEMLLARILQKIKAFNMQGIRPYQLAVSFGMARCEPGNFISLDALINEADRAMYSQKQAKNQS